MDINELVEIIVESESACAQCACATDDECLSAECREKIFEYLTEKQLKFTQAKGTRSHAESATCPARLEHLSHSA